MHSTKPMQPAYSVLTPSTKIATLQKEGYEELRDIPDVDMLLYLRHSLMGMLKDTKLMTKMQCDDEITNAVLHTEQALECYVSSWENYTKKCRERDNAEHDKEKLLEAERAKTLAQVQELINSEMNRAQIGAAEEGDVWFKAKHFALQEFATEFANIAKGSKR